MKQYKFKGIKENGKGVSGSWFSQDRCDAKRIAERLAGSKLRNFVNYCIDVKDKMIKLEEN